MYGGTHTIRNKERRVKREERDRLAYEERRKEENILKEKREMFENLYGYVLEPLRAAGIDPYDLKRMLNDMDDVV